MIVLLGCGSSGGEESRSCAQPADRYLANYARLDAVGSCDMARNYQDDPMQFSGGQYVPALSGLMACNTAQTGCSISVVCTGHVINVRIDFTGQLSEGATKLDGLATLSGAYAGCERVVYAVAATAD